MADNCRHGEKQHGQSDGEQNWTQTPGRLSPADDDNAREENRRPQDDLRCRRRWVGDRFREGDPQGRPNRADGKKEQQERSHHQASFSIAQQGSASDDDQGAEEDCGQ